MHHSSILIPFVSYAENEVLWIRLQGLYPQYFIFFVAYEWAQFARVLHYTKLKRLAWDQQSSLFGSLACLEETEFSSSVRVPCLDCYRQFFGQFGRHFCQKIFVGGNSAQIFKLFYLLYWLSWSPLFYIPPLLIIGQIFSWSKPY